MSSSILFLSSFFYWLKHLVVLASRLTISYKFVVKIIKIDLELEKFKRRFKIILE